LNEIVDDGVGTDDTSLAMRETHIVAGMAS
jgi:hypothetical protein